MSTAQLIFYLIGVLTTCLTIGFVVGYVGFGFILRRNR